ncbi:hypothetical protein RintRC_6687 [Richelia intracellularis]|nr:hypothetical protein RintRC_6687 [Richelia intracellularis]
MVSNPNSSRTYATPDFLRRALFNLDAQPQLFRQSLNFLSCT